MATKQTAIDKARSAVISRLRGFNSSIQQAKQQSQQREATRMKSQPIDWRTASKNFSANLNLLKTNPEAFRQGVSLGAPKNPFLNEAAQMMSGMGARLAGGGANLIGRNRTPSQRLSGAGDVGIGLGQSATTAYGLSKLPLAAGYTALGGLFSGAVNKYQGGDFSDAFIEGAQRTAPRAVPMAGLGSITSPLIGKVVPKVGGLPAQMATGAGLNWLEGLGMDRASGLETTKQSQALDLTMGALMPTSGPVRRVVGGKVKQLKASPTVARVGKVAGSLPNETYAGAFMGTEIDENGNISYNPVKGAFGALGGYGVGRMRGSEGTISKSYALNGGEALKGHQYQEAIENINRRLANTTNKTLIKQLEKAKEQIKVEQKALYPKPTQPRDKMGQYDFYSMGGGRVPDSKLDPLIAEARKYKSAEEFISGVKDDLLFHGTPEKFEGKLKGGKFDDVLWTADRPDIAQEYITSKDGKGILYTLSGKKNLKIYDATNMGHDLQNPAHLDSKLLESARKQGYDGIKIDDFAQDKNWGNLGHHSIGLFESGIKKVKQLGKTEAGKFNFGDRLYQVDTPESKKVLTDIYNQATKGVGKEGLTKDQWLKKQKALGFDDLSPEKQKIAKEKYIKATGDTDEVERGWKEFAYDTKTLKVVGDDVPSYEWSVSNQVTKGVPEVGKFDINEFNRVYNSGPSKVATPTKLDEANALRKAEQVSYQNRQKILRDAGLEEPKSYSQKDIDEYNRRVTELLGDKTTPLPEVGGVKTLKAKPSEASLKGIETPQTAPARSPGAVEPTLQTKLAPEATPVQSAEVLRQSKGGKGIPLETIVQQANKEIKVGSKVGLLDYLRTPDRVLNKIGMGREAKLLRTKYNSYLDQLPKEIEKVTAWSQRVGPESNQRIFQYLDGQPVQLDANEAKVAKEIQQYLGDWADKLQLPKDKRIASYITHIFEKDFINKEFDPEFAKLIQDKVAGSVYDPFLEKRLGKVGYVEDTWRALDAYVKRATRKYNMDQALSVMKEKAKGLETSQYKYVKQHIDRVNMRPTDWDNLLDNSIKQVVGYKFGQRPTAMLTKKGRQWVYRGTLGLNPGSAIKNLTQGANTYAALGEKYTIKGYLTLAKKMASGSDELERVGVLRNNFIEDRTLNATKKFWEKFDKGLFVFFEGAEKINRGAAYFGAKAKALDKGLSEEAATEFATDVVRKTQFTFGSIDTPPILQSDIAKLLGQFQSFTLKQGEFLGEMVAAKNIAGLVRYGLASYVLTNTVGNIIGMDEKDFIPQPRFGLPPTLSAPIEIGKSIFGTKDEYGNERTMEERIKDAGSSLIPFIPAGTQMKKTFQGLTDVSRGYSESASGRVRYPVEQSASQYARGGLFGRYNLPEAQEYRDQERSVLSENQSVAFKSMPNQERAGFYEKIMASRAQNKELDELKKSISKGKMPEETGKLITFGDKTGFVKNDGDISTFATKEKAQKALDKYNFEQSDEEYTTIGDTFYYRDDAGEVRTKPMKDIQDKQYDLDYTLKLEQAKRNDDVETWFKTQDAYLARLSKEYDELDPNNPLDMQRATEIENKVGDILELYGKYKGYGGFTKPKAGKSAKAVKIKEAKLPKVKRSEYNSAIKALKAVKLGDLPKPKVTQDAMSVARLQVLRNPKVKVEPMPTLKYTKA